MATKKVEVTIANFTYEKKPGEQSDRKILIVQRPSDSILGVEIKNNDLNSVKPMVDYLADLELAKARLMEKHGLKDADLSYRRFKVDKITNIIESNVTVK